MLLNVNTIEFNGRKACINSYSDHPLLVAAMNEQRERFAAHYPNAIVKTERMTEAECVALVATDPSRHASWEIGQASLA